MAFGKKNSSMILSGLICIVIIAVALVVVLLQSNKAPTEMRARAADPCEAYKRGKPIPKPGFLGTIQSMKEESFVLTVGGGPTTKIIVVCAGTTITNKSNAKLTYKNLAVGNKVTVAGNYGDNTGTTILSTSITQNSKSTVSTPTPTPSLGNKISWRTQTVSLEADDFYIIANGKKYYAKPDPGTTMTVGSDPGGATYTTLEATWTEQGAEMRLYMYFKADTQNWWSYEMRTYNGVKYVQNVSYPDWIYYYGPFFKSPLGTSVAVRGDTLFKSSPENKYQGNIFFRNLRLSVNFRGTTPSPYCTPQPCPAPKEV